MSRFTGTGELPQHRPGRATLASLAVLAATAIAGTVLTRVSRPAPTASSSTASRTAAPAPRTTPAPAPAVAEAPRVCSSDSPEPAVCLSEAPSRGRLLLNAASATLAAASEREGKAALPDPEPPLPPQPAPLPSPDVEALPPPPPRPELGPDSGSTSNRVKVRDEDGRVVTARLYGGPQSQVVLLPDGRLGWPKSLPRTDEPFLPESPESLANRLTQGPFAGFEVRQTPHYLVLFEGRPQFAEASAALLESLYAGLLGKLREKGFDVHDAEFPLVAVIFRDEQAFRAFSQMPEDVLAFYNVLTNQIFLYERSERDETAPDVAARRRPQTVAHEGTHQILQNIGLQPRMAHWPPWLVEGLAEYFAPTTIGKDGHWDGANRINPFHMATLRDLQDPVAQQLQTRGLDTIRIGRDPGQPVIEYLISRKELTPTDYALSWALTYYLANKHFDEFVAYLKELSERSPLERCPTEVHLADFRRHFGDDLARLDRSWTKYLAGLKNFENLPCYAVRFEQPLPNGIVRRGAFVSHSPAMIRQWLEEMTAPEGGAPAWHAIAYPTKSRARLAVESWFQNGR